jgi:activator of 2-hydroxyglutaryl-CoA dehydratase
MRGERPVKISTTCTVFAESEVLSWLGKGKKIEDVLLGVHQSIGARSVGLLRRVGVTDQVTFTGGVARNPAMIAALESRLDLKLNVSEESHFMGAIGAALFALDRILASRIPASENLAASAGSGTTAGLEARG